ncbi:MAG: hypothetical protein KGP28_08855 [Bdellovibrionales bacterium]|nr:hypothetical protein [Bdellovibrionales bacterium]
MVLGVLGVLGWLIMAPDSTRQMQEELLRTSSPELMESFQKVMDHPEAVGVERSPASAPRASEAGGVGVMGASTGAQMTGAAETSRRDTDSLSDLVQAPVRDEGDLRNRFDHAKQLYSETHSDAAVGTLRELMSMTRAIYPDSPAIQEMEKDLDSVEQDRIQRINQGAL